VNYPKISVITPSFNQGDFLEQTITSVLGQNYPNLEYIIIDGGSTDKSIDIIKEYADRITYWISEKDNGQSHAINKGFAKASGDILCWLNSDDYYLPNVLKEVGEKLNIHQPELFYGNCIHLDQEHNQTHGSYFDPFNQYDIFEGDFITQPSSFWTRKAWEETGILDESLTYSFDWEWYARAKLNGILFIPSKTYFSVYRIHNSQKSNPNDQIRTAELFLTGKKLNPQKYLHIDEQIKDKKFWIDRLIKSPINKRIKHNAYRFLFPKLYKIISFANLYNYITCSIKNKD
jgi:glycosyltransferase involved in cell wall biosynthesis